MAEKMIELIYSQQHTDFIEGRAYSNPRFFTGPRSGVSKVYLVGDWPEIEAAYAAIDVPVERLDAVAALGVPEVKDLAIPAAPIVPAVTADERAKTHIPEDWQNLPWTGAADAGLTLRSLAALFSDTPVLNKGQAKKAIQAELDRRAKAGPDIDAPNEDAGGLTLRELHADLAALNVEFDPADSAADLLVIRDVARAERDAAE
ncbi:MAG: hypothetical protein KAY29_00855, partial [Brevundimonas sp.]|jgi:hypothetical protein|nr:hypothetical protein [Brevundimonas sp.]